MSHAETAPLGDRMRSAGFALAAIALLVVARIVIEGRGWKTEMGEPLFALGFLTVAGALGGKLVAAVGLPRLTGYLAVGVLSGPHAFALFGAETVKGLTLINSLALALIALQAGAELTTDMVRRSAKSVVLSTAVQSALQPVFMAVCFMMLASQLEFTRHLELGPLIAVSAVWGVIALSKSPAATLAVLGETKAKGPLTEHVLGVVVVLDVFVLVLFSVAIAVARSQLIPDSSFALAEVLHLGQELFASIAAGTSLGLVIAGYFRVVGRAHLLFIVVIGYAVSAACAYLRYDTLLVFVVAGFVVSNLTRRSAELIDTAEQLSSGVMIVFFATAGAKLDLEVLRQGWVLALGLVVARAAMTWLSCQGGHRLAKDPPVVRRYAFLGFVSQAGVTIGLASIAADALPGVGAGLATLTIAVVGINELIGPILFKLALTRAKEIPAVTGGRETSSVPP